MSIIGSAGRRVALTLFMLAPSLAGAQDFKAGDLVIRHPWARATPGGAKVGGGYLDVINHGTTPDKLTGGSFEASTGFELHGMTIENGVMKMRPTGPLTIPPGGTLTLDPSGTHIMFTGLKHGLKKGEEVDGTLTFEHAGTVPVHFTVEGVGAKGPSGGHDKGSMPGMTMD
jgi:periplasmic copper chaperone A